MSTPEAGWESPTIAALQLTSPSQAQHYAKAVMQPLKALGVHLLLEPGRAIIAPAGVLITRVVYRKRNEGKRFIVVDAAMNDLIRPSLYSAYHEIVPVVAKAGPRAGNGRHRGPGLRERGLLCPRPRDGACGGGRAAGDSRCRSLWNVAGVELQYAAARGGGAGERQASPPHPQAGIRRRSTGAGAGVAVEPAFRPAFDGCDLLFVCRCNLRLQRQTSLITEPKRGPEGPLYQICRKLSRYQSATSVVLRLSTSVPVIDSFGYRQFC